MTSASNSLYMAYDHCAGWTHNIHFHSNREVQQSYILHHHIYT